MSGEANHNRKKYAVAYRDDERKVCFTMLVSARSMSHAVKLAVQFIDHKNLHPYDYPYFLTPTLAHQSIVPTYNLDQ